MKAIQLREPLCFERIELPESSPPGPGEALVRTHSMGICGTDIKGYLGKFPFYSYPRIPGHELGVEVLETGPEVQQIHVGDRCSVEPYMNCPDSFASRLGRGNCCQDLQVLGVHIDGGLRDCFVVRADKLHPSAKLSFEQLALVETLAVGRHAAGRGEPQADEHALIIGVGPIGLATLEFVRLSGAEVTVMDVNTERLDFCRGHYEVPHVIQFRSDGSHLSAMEAITRGELYRVVFDATGNIDSMNNAVQYVAHTGTMVYVGLTDQQITIPNPFFHAGEMTIKATRNALPHEFQETIRLIEEEKIDTDCWITHRIPFDQMIDEFDSYTKPEAGAVKAVVKVN